MNHKVDFFFEKGGKWQGALEQLRDICLDSGLDEVLKWGCPCYAQDGKNVVLIHSFKEYCALLFFKGALMKDPKNLLIQQTENVQAARQMRFTSAEDVAKHAKAIGAYIKEAIKVEESGAKVELKKTTKFAMPDEFAKTMKEMPDIKDAFEKLTPGRQRAYLLHFASAKQSKTREARIEKAIPDILDGRGLNE
ncbi:MAG: YdeI/OmpD-associated family protein [Taibaiella sp.]|nr:YdeI/OmpD-associated family protein [Taibaiella sp.]